MSNSALHRFIDRVIAGNFIAADDVKQLRDEILADGITSQFAADALLALDRTLDADPAWADFLVPAIVDFSVWGLRPTGIVNPEIANWLLTAFTTGEPTPAARRIVAAIAEEAETIDPSLLLYARRAALAGSAAAA